MITRTVKIPPPLDARVRQAARASGVSYSEAARRAIESGLKDAGGINMAAALSEFAGCIKGAPDLSSSKAHLADYGSPGHR